MKVEIFYVAGCPSHPGAVELVKSLLAEQGAAAEIHQILVEDQQSACELSFPGSPTIRINGRDVAGVPPGTSSFALNCRLYPGSEEMGLPSREAIRRAVSQALQERRT
jgi:hypothetical protein